MNKMSDMFRLKPTYNYEFYQALSQNDMPPTLYSLMNSKINFDEENQTSITDLPSAFRTYLFDFDYGLNSSFRQDFEETFLTNFMFRRINYDTYLSFKLHLKVKLKSIMPKYNKMLLGFNSLDFEGYRETKTRELTNDRTINEDNSISNTGTSSGTSSGTNTGTNTGTTSGTNDNRYSDTPQGQLSSVQNGTYLTDYTYNQTSGSSSETSSNQISNTSSGTSSSNITEDKEKTDNSSVNEEITTIKLDTLDEYKKFLEFSNNIYDMIFKECETLFFGVV